MKSARWARLRAAQLAKQPYCQCPHHAGKSLRADHPGYGGPVVDHVTAHRGDSRLFFDASNLQSMTKQCHDSRKQSEEKGGAGFLKGVDANGQPLSKAHPWYDAR